MFPSPSGGGASPYRAKKRRFPKLVSGLGQDTLRRAKNRNVGMKGGGAYKVTDRRTPINPGKKPPKGGGLKPLPRNLRVANKGTSPTTEPNQGPTSSAPYRAAKRRTASKFRRRSGKKGF